MNNLFTADIHDWQSWGSIFQSIDAWNPLIRHIFQRESLPFDKVEHLTPGTNAVFRVGNYVVKIFAPVESGIDSTMDVETEIFAMKYVNSLDIPAPKCVANGCVEDKYQFFYMVMEYINGTEFTNISKSLSPNQKTAFAKRLRVITDKMDSPCKRFNAIDVIADKGRYRRWDKYPYSFREERLEYLKTRDFGEQVFVHGDLCGDNILVSNTGELCIIDFADAVLAPAIYEQALVASELFKFDKDYLRGYFGDYDTDTLTDLCFSGLLIHDFGGDIMAQHVARPDEITSLRDMQEKLSKMIKE